MKLAIVAFVALSNLPVSAQVEATVGADTPAVWSGEPRADLTPMLELALSIDTRDLGDQTARTIVRLRTTRDFGTAAEELAALRLRAARREGLDAKIVRDITRARVELMLAVGKSEAAARAARLPLPTAKELRDALEPAIVEAADPDWVSERVREAQFVLSGLNSDGASANQAETKLTLSLSPAAQEYLEATCGTPSGPLAEFVEKALYHSSFQKVQDLGAQATPALVWLTLEDPAFANARELEADPFEMLIGVDEGAAADLALAWIERGGDAWRWRVLHALRSSEVHKSAAGWISFDGDLSQAAQPRYPVWHQVLLILLSDQRLQSEALLALRDIAAWNGLSSGLQTFLASLIRNGDAALSQRVLNAIYQSGYSVPTATPVFLAGLSNAHPEVRRECARRLSWLPDPPDAFRDFATDSDPVVRKLVASSLDMRDLNVPRAQGNWLATFESRRTEPFGAAELAILEALLNDQDPDVRAAASKTLRTRPEIHTSLFDVAAASQAIEVRAQVARNVEHWYQGGVASSDEALQRLIVDPAPEVRAGLMKTVLHKIPVAAQVRIAEALADDSEPLVLAALDGVLERGTAEMSIDALVAALPIRSANTSTPFRPNGAGFDGWMQLNPARMDERNFELYLALIAIGLDRGLDEFVSECVEDMAFASGSPTRNSGFLQGLATEHRVALYDWCENSSLPTEEIAAFVFHGTRYSGDEEACRLALTRSDLSRGWVWKLAPLAIGKGASDLTDLCAGYFRDPNQKPIDRLRAGALSKGLGVPADRRLFLDLIRSLDPVTNGAEVELLGSVTRAFSESNALLLEAMRDERMADSVLLEAARGFDWDQANAPATAVAILERWVDRTNSEAPVRSALQYLDERALVIEHANLVIQASRSDNYAELAARAMGRYQDPRFIEPLGAVLALDGGSYSHEAIRALLRYGSPEAADQLRAGLLVLDSDGRQAVLDALESLDRYWELERSSTNRVLGTREDALAELAAMLSHDDPTLRAEAALSMAAFGALESLPKLIQMLKDEDEGVREAARDAIERLRHL